MVGLAGGTETSLVIISFVVVLTASNLTVEAQQDPTAPMLRLADGSNEHEGRVEIFVNGEWGTVCDDNWDLLDALVVCKQLGLGTVPEAFIEAEFGRGTGEIWLDEVGCTGEEDRLIDCSSLGIGNNNCGHSEDAGVRCHANANCSDGAIRLVNGSTSTNGRVEVCQFGRWGTVCDDVFDTVDAMVACDQLGFGGGIVIATTIPGSGPIWLDDVACCGSEVRLVDCSATKFDQSNCGHNEDVSIMCYAGLNAEMGTCTASVDCNGAAGDVIATTTLEDCCLNTAGLAFNDSAAGQCTPCIVFGFFKDLFTGLEKEQSHVVQAGWQKGAAQAGVNIILNVISTEITAREGAGFDYTVSTTQVRFLYRRPDPPDDVVVIFRVDDIAQESNETFTLELNCVPDGATLPTGSNVFFRNTINMTIIDSDVVSIFFSEDDYRADEAPEKGAGPTSFMPVRVVKTSRIANPIVLYVISLTVDMARANTPPALPDNIPVNNPFSPPFADLNDFNNSVIRITFNPDEDANNDEHAAPIALIDDTVNEADEQVFVVQLHLVDSINSSAIDLTTRATSLCRIIDDDTIRIGYEVAQYTYTEPIVETTIDEVNYIPPTNLTANGPINLIKEDNVVSEQTFFVAVQISNSVPSGSRFRQAQINVDYDIGVAIGTSRVLQFPATFQRILFSFTLLSDTIPEGTEAFLASSTPADSALINGVEFDVPGYLPPVNLFPQSYVIIEDDDRIIIGFKETIYTVNESIGMLQVNVSVSNPPDNVELFASVDLVIQTVSNTATGKVDYEELNANDFDVSLPFDDATRQMSFEVIIIDDNLFESVEDFNLELRFDPTRPLSGVIFSPNMSTVYILDDDGITIGFVNNIYSTLTDGSQFIIQVAVLEGRLQREVIVNLSIDNTYLHSFTFNSTTTTLDLPMSIINEVIFELTESATANITFAGDPVPRVTLSPSSASISIDALIIGFDRTEYSVDESGGNITLTILVRGVTTRCEEREWMIQLSTRDMTAHYSEDYTATTVSKLIFNDTAAVTVAIEILNDKLLEVNETFRVDLSIIGNDSSNCVLVQPNSVDVLILDNDIAVIGFDSENYTITEGENTFLFIAVKVIKGQLGREVVSTLMYRNVTATNGSDFNISITDNQLTFDQNKINASFSIEIIDDDLFEEAIEDFFVLLSTDVPNLIIEPNVTRVSIIDNDTITIGFMNTTYAVDESIGTAHLTVLVNGKFGEDVSTSLKVAALNFSAEVLLDFEVITIELNFSRNVSMQTIEVTIVDDGLLEEDEEFQLILVNELANADDKHRIILMPDKTNVTILDNDTVFIGFTDESFTVTEGGVQNIITVGLTSGQLGREVEVILDLQHDSAIDGDDFSALTDHRLTFSPSNNYMPQNVSLDIYLDGRFEYDETFNATLTSGFVGLKLNVKTIQLKNALCDKDEGSDVFSVSQVTSVDKRFAIPLDRVLLTEDAGGIELRLANVESDRVSVGPLSAQVTILDDDSITIGFDSNNYSVRECDGHVTVRVKVNGSQLEKKVVTVNLSTSDMSAFANVNYQRLTNHQLTFSQEADEIHDIPIDIYITNDTDIGMDEEFLVTLSYSGEDVTRVSLEPQNTTVAIFEISGRVGFFSPLNIMVNEGDTVNITVGLMSEKLCDFVEVMINFTTNNSDTTGNDYSLQPESPLTLTSERPNATITISIFDDDSIESSKTFEINLCFYDEMIENCSYNRLKLSPSTVTVQIIDNDGDVPTTAPVAASVSSTSNEVLIASILGAVAFLLIIGIILLIIIVCYINKRNNQKNSVPTLDDENVIPEALRGLSVQSSYKLNLAPYLIIDSSTIRMTETIGQGEFGVVYKAHIMRSEIVTETVAVKTLKGFYDKSTVRDMLKECSKMSKFDHPNVLKLRGVCVDGGPSPFIIMPFMTNGSLLSYLKSNRGTLIVAQRSDLEDDEDDQMSVILKRLMDMCLQVAMGMEYLAMKKVVHRDLAARNCMIDMNFVIKVADFGLAESVGTKDYFRQDKFANVKLPFKWLAPESLEDYIFSEKSDVWAYGVTSWEVFTAGKVPYATVNLLELPSLLANGHRLKKPANEACSDEMYSLMLHCWETDPKDRPTFSDIVRSLSVALEGLVGYMDIGAFGEKAEPKQLDPETSADKPKSDDSSVKDLSESKVCESQDDQASCEETKL